jgi:FkbM family methyltransferase
MNIKEIKKLIKDKWFILLFILLFIFFIIYHIIDNTYIEYNNPYIDNDNIKLKWNDINSKFMKDNWPNTFDFDFEIKKDLLDKSLKLPKNYGIIDCGAHIGDGSIPLAHALKYYNREDIIVYAIDPSKYKCDYIQKIADINDIKNIKVIHYGLANKDNIEYTYIQQPLEENGTINSGGTNWKKKEELNNKEEIIQFIKLDTLIQNNIIKHNIGVIHLDVEGMELDAIKGGLNCIQTYKPYLSLEDHTDDTSKYIEILNDYKFIKRINSNNTFSPINT